MPDQKTFDPSKVVMSVANVDLTEFAKGSLISVEYESDSFTDEVAVDGTVVRILSRDERATIKVSLSQASPSNDALSALAAQDRLTGQGAGAVLVQDAGPGGSTKASAPAGWVKKIPAKTFSTEAASVDWEIRCNRLKLFIGGTTET